VPQNFGQIPRPAGGAGGSDPNFEGLWDSKCLKILVRSPSQPGGLGDLTQILKVLGYKVLQNLSQVSQPAGGARGSDPNFEGFWGPKCLNILVRYPSQPGGLGDLTQILKGFGVQSDSTFGSDPPASRGGWGI
jgi:hypothetical protein